MSIAPDSTGLVLLRVAGLPAKVMAPLSSPGLDEGVYELDLLRRKADAARRDLVESLYELVHGALPEDRRFLLALKRDAFNGRNLEKHAQAALRLPNASAEHFSRALQLQKGLQELEKTFADKLAGELRRQHAALAAHLSDARFLRAITLSSQVLRTELETFPPHWVGQPGRRERRLQGSLLRYLSRAALKLSPFSTFTAIGLGRLEERPGEVRFVTAEARDSGIVRVQPAFLDQLLALLRSYRPFQDLLEVEVNPTLVETEPSRFQWFRPGHWTLDGKNMAYQGDAFLRLVLTDPFILQVVQGPRRRDAGTFEQLEQELAERFPTMTPEKISMILEKMRQLGLILLRCPWQLESGYLEEEMARGLSGLGSGRRNDGLLAELAKRLHGLVELERSFASTSSPAAVLSRLEEMTGEIWQLASAGILGNATIPYVRIKENQFFEDVLQTPADPRWGPAMATLPGPTLRQLAAEVEPLLQISHALDPRFEFLEALESQLAGHWGPDGELPIAVAFELAKKIFNEMLARERQGLPQLPDEPGPSRELKVLHERLRRLLAASVVDAPDGKALDRIQLERWKAEIPAGLRCEVGSCLMVQPAGDLWVLNRLFEGDGRYSSRFGVLLDAATYQRYAEPFAAASATKDFCLLDLFYPQGDTLNVHRPLTARLLVNPGERPPRGAPESVDLADLRLRRGQPGSFATLHDASGRRYVPVHLGGAARRYMPTLFRFLSMFGPTELNLHLPSTPLEKIGDAEVRPRLSLGSLVLRRKRWIFAAEGLPPEVFDESPEAAAYQAVALWRRRYEIPARIFLIENVHHKEREDLFKPQYLDLSSPLFVSLLRAALKVHRGPICFEEMLPTPEMAPSNPAGESYLVELMLEAPTLRMHAEPTQ